MFTICKLKNNLSIFVFCSFILSCNKLVQIDPPANSITSSEVFADSVNAFAALNGLYANLKQTNSSYNFSSGATTLFLGTAADELKPFSASTDVLQFQDNTILPPNAVVQNFFWSDPYRFIYEANAIIAGVESNNSSTFSESSKKEVIAEAKCLRAFCYFYLTNLFGDVPLILGTDYRTNQQSSRSQQAQVYDQIISDLLDAQANLPDNYDYGGGERIRVTKWAATALLARTYLYLGKWADAESQATVLINNSLFQLVPDLKSVFSPNSAEAILQWQMSPAYNPYNATPEGTALIPNSHTSPPLYYLRPELKSQFEANDNRRANWVDSTIYRNNVYYFPFKYTTGNAQKSVNGAAAQYYTVLRIAEEYLIRAEARAWLGEPGASDDLNSIRHRAGLGDYSGPQIRDSILKAIYHERQIEFFAEWGHRWLDLKRTGLIDQTMSQEKPDFWRSYQQLFPIPQRDITLGPNLTQNPGY